MTFHREHSLDESRTAELRYLAVHPEMQGKGIGTALVVSGMEQARKLHLDIFIMAMKGGVGLYKRLGFRTVREFVQDDSVYGGPGEHYICLMSYEQDHKSLE